MAMNDPAVSIILRSFNEAWALQNTLPALQAQHYLRIRWRQRCARLVGFQAGWRAYRESKSKSAPRTDGIQHHHTAP